MEENLRNSDRAYEAPTLLALGSVAELTQHFDKRWGGSDGWVFVGINVPVHNVSP
jgi:hypothetical protein